MATRVSSEQVLHFGVRDHFLRPVPGRRDRVLERVATNESHARPRRWWVPLVGIALAAAVAGAFAIALPRSTGEAEEVTQPRPVAAETAITEATYRDAAATCAGLSWTVLAAIHEIETRGGSGAITSSEGAQGPMQFMPSTWAAFGVDASGDGRADINNPTDAMHGAARYLCENGGGDPARLAGALYAYNHSTQYVAQVLATARALGGGS